jgi:hypothetical protein
MTSAMHEQITVKLHEERAGCEVVDFSMLGLVIAGLSGLLATTGALYAAPAVGLPRIDVIGLAGSMFTEGFLPSVVVGTVLWTGIGMLFAILYVGLWAHGYGRPTLRSGALLGLIHGNIVMALYPVFVATHPLLRGTAVPLSAGVCLVLAHLVFGVVVASVYRVYLSDVPARD